MKTYADVPENKETDESKNADNDQNSKFMTQMNSSSKAQYYSFGAQYRYTENLQNHHLYVKPKYSSVKEELFGYFRRNNEKADCELLKATQI